MNKFNLNQKIISKNEWEITRTALSNQIGGILFMYGPIQTNKQHNQYIQTRPLYSSSPSRTKFARSFLWDEGFHLEVICRWNIDICMEIIDHWMNTIFPNGWIPREQIRGKEIENYAVIGFIQQLENEQNPPTLIFAIEYLIEINKNYNSQIIPAFLKEQYPKIEQWFQWNVKNKMNYQNQSYFQWYKNQKYQLFLASGLDDYPRPNSFLYENLDLFCWVMKFSEIVTKLSKLNENKKSDEYESYYQQLKQKLLSFIQPNTSLFQEKISSSDFFNSLGYVNLFPFIFGQIDPNSKQFYSTLDLILDPNLLWSKYGLRSIGKKSNYFQSGNQYWTGPIWININYLVLKSMKLYYFSNPIIQQTYKKLKSNLKRNLIDQFKKNQILYENYNMDDGKGQGVENFAGWTALISLIILENY